MPVTNISFGVPPINDTPESCDVHVLRGQQSDVLRDRVWVQDAADGQWRTFSDYSEHNHDVEVAFSPVFKAQDAGTEFHNFGIHVNKATGRVTVDGGAAPEPSPSNFLVEAFVTDNGTGIAPVRIAFAILRVHVHRSVAKVWLTPGKLSVRRTKSHGEETTDYIFTVRAQFDDGTVGDVTDSDELTFSPPAWFLVRWVRIPASAAPTVAPFTVTVRTSAKWNSRSATAQLEVLPAWESEPAMLAAELVDGAPKVWDGTLKPEKVPNVLFLACGFRPEHEDAFKEITNLIVHRLKRDPMVQPFGYLGTSINYWRLMVPAQEPGVSVRCEVELQMRGGQLFATPLPSPAEPPPAAVDWELQHLIYMAGLPVPADLDLVKDVDTHQRIGSADELRTYADDKVDISALQDKWIKIMRLDDPVGMVHTIAPGLATMWLALSDRTFIDEVNNFPPVSLGAPPAAAFNDTGDLGYHGNRPRFDAWSDPRSAFFRRVVAAPRDGITVSLDDGGGQAPELGRLWAEDRTGAAFDNRAFVAALSNTPFGRANAAIHTRLSLYATQPDGDLFIIPGIPVTRVADRNALTLALPAPSVAMLADGTWRVFAHELAHTFGLGDEYAESTGVYSGDEASLGWTANLTTTAAVLAPDKKVRLDAIKWNWHRVRNASVITLPVVPDPGGNPPDHAKYRVFVRKGSGFQFTQGQKVCLRTRDSRTGLAPASTLPTPVEFVVDAVHAENLASPDDPLNMTIVLDGPASDVAPFKPGSIVYAPVPLPAGVDLPGQYLTLVSPAAQRLMNEIGGTMTGVDCDVAFLSQNVGGGTQTPVGEHPDIKVPADELPGLVGVYFGGRQYSCGVLHPTGHCMMRNEYDDAARFCPVCRYALVERIDPDQHWWIDRDYDPHYFL